MNESATRKDIDEFIYIMKDFMSQVSSQFNAVNDRLDKVDKRLDQLDQKYDRLIIQSIVLSDASINMRLN